MGRLRRVQRVLRKHEDISQKMKQEIFQTFVTSVTVKIGKGERLQDLTQSKVDVQLLPATAGTDMTGLLPMLDEENPHLPAMEQIHLKLGLNINEYLPFRPINLLQKLK